MLSLTFTNITENELNDYYNKLKGVHKDVKKAEELQGPTKIRKVTLKDFKKDFKDDAKTARHKKEKYLKMMDLLIKKEIIFIFIFQSYNR
jgi:hypothetical protein